MRTIEKELVLASSLLGLAVLTASGSSAIAAPRRAVQIFEQVCLDTGVDFDKIKAMAVAEQWQSMPSELIARLTAPGTAVGETTSGWIVEEGPKNLQVAVILRTPGAGSKIPPNCSIDALEGNIAGFVQELEARSGARTVTSKMVGDDRQWELTVPGQDHQVGIIVVGSPTSAPAPFEANAHLMR